MQINKNESYKMYYYLDMDLEDKYTEINEYCKNKDKKLLFLLNKIIDKISKNILIIKSGTAWELQLLNECLGFIKIQTKKIIVELTKYELIINFVIGKDNENIKNLEIIENFLK
jgi:hypothetical protein